VREKAVKIAVLMTCFNRVQTTVNCLDHFYGCQRPEGWQLDVYLVDDGSPDGTGRIVAQSFPDVRIIQGTGHLYWCGGMRLAWKAASEAADYDGYLWLNDDTLVFPSALSEIASAWAEASGRQAAAAIICGCTCNAQKTRCTYGGRSAAGALIDPTGQSARVDFINGNMVLVPKEVFLSVGNFPGYFTHALGDFDYSLRAEKVGHHSYITGNYVGVCEKGADPSWIDSAVPFSKRVRTLYSPKGSATPPVYFRFILTHYGLLTAMRRWLLLHVRVCLPSLWVKHGRF
jgi:GT2 family glycosyltransferase